MTEQQGAPVTGLVWRLSMRWRAAIDRAITPLGLTNAQYSVLAPLLGLERPAGGRASVSWPTSPGSNRSTCPNWPGPWSRPG